MASTERKDSLVAGMTATVASAVAQTIYWLRYHHFMNWFILGGAIVATTLVWTIINERRSS
jgi:hypothetical protein